MTSSYGEIVERLEKATGPSYALEVEIGRALGYPAELLQPPPNFTYSLDRAMHVAKAKLDNGAIDIEVAYRSVGGKGFGRAEICGPRVDEAAIGATPAIALLICLFRALTVNENG